MVVRETKAGKYRAKKKSGAERKIERGGGVG